MKAEWTDPAREMATTLLRYTYREFGKKQADKLKVEFTTLALRLEAMPRMAPLEPALENLDGEYRSLLLFTWLKVIYQITDCEHLYIVALWDTRRNPNRLRQIIT